MLQVQIAVAAQYAFAGSVIHFCQTVNHIALLQCLGQHHIVHPKVVGLGKYHLVSAVLDERPHATSPHRHCHGMAFTDKFAHFGDKQFVVNMFLFNAQCLMLNSYCIMTQPRCSLIGQTLQMVHTHQRYHLFNGTHDAVITTAVPYHHATRA